MDEADRLLDKIDSDFAQDLDTIFEALPKERFVVLPCRVPCILLPIRRAPQGRSAKMRICINIK